VRLFDLNTLFRLHWGGRNQQGETWAQLQETLFKPLLRKFEDELATTHWLSYGVVYGYYPVAREGDDLLLFRPDNHSQLLTRWSFPRQPDRDRLCLSDYFCEASAGRDVAVLQAVTVGKEATRRIEELQASANYTDAYYLNGFADSLAEGLAEWTHRHIRAELGLPVGQGLRYSWGYPSCPDLSQQHDVLQLLAADRIGLSLTAGNQLLPEQSTAAIVVHHPDAVYFTTGVERKQQEHAVREVLGELDMRKLSSST
jgi:5-methyltetrahydrofolate--homocysteine methyltransferase